MAGLFEHNFRHVMLERLMHYYLYLQKHSLSEGEWISSSEIAGYFQMDDTQVRKDLAAVGIRGRPRLGYRRGEVAEQIKKWLGIGNTYNAVIVGAGRLGGAIAEYKMFQDYGLKLKALFDNDPLKIGKRIGGYPIYDVRYLRRQVEQMQIQLGIITCPAEIAQQCVDELAAGGVRAIWNFAPINLNVHKNIFLRNEHISIGLGELAYYMKRQK